MDWNTGAPVRLLQYWTQLWGYIGYRSFCLIFFLSLLFFLLPHSSYATETFLVPLGPVAHEQKTHFFWATALTMVAILPVFVLVPVILIKYRRKKGKGIYAPKWESYGPLELIMWGVPFLVIFVLSFMLWRATSMLDPYKEIEGVVPPVKVQVVGLDWKWLFIYPELKIATVGELVVPVHTPVSMILTSDTVMQSFWIAALAGQIYVMPGMTTRLNFIATKNGKTQGENTQYTGKGFTEQKFDVLIKSEEDFQDWVAQVRTNGITLDPQTYKRLAMRSTRKEMQKQLATPQMPSNALYFTLSDPQLFQSIVMRYHSGKPLSMEEQPGTVKFGQGEEKTEGAQP
ncbi:ubiquinol oxidase subunit II [Microbulbifer sp. THAF38]|uniref:ubiquinol oxidase subunit II n=1 Tax=Microbulbifer sp. THAF38 TaxID=2587856 RepID=UPI001268CE28|nr:ubiquinol oxidase subunit II [Microbulbifer sp. THAF38]QFT55623.1 Cytochrome bo(3) ubiquinol oxidase subunit 2 precursor [Microbulbifer sp. THAF38]